MSTARTRVYRDGALAADGFPVTAVSDYLAEPDTVVWVDFCRPSPEELIELRDELGLHELAIEDALSPHQRPKLDHYESHMFLAAHAVHVDPAAGELAETGWDDAITGPTWAFVEWPGRIGRHLPSDRIDVAIRIDGPTARTFTFTPRGGLTLAHTLAVP